MTENSSTEQNIVDGLAARVIGYAGCFAVCSALLAGALWLGDRKDAKEVAETQIRAKVTCIDSVVRAYTNELDRPDETFIDLPPFGSLDAVVYPSAEGIVGGKDVKGWTIYTRCIKDARDNIYGNREKMMFDRLVKDTQERRLFEQKAEAE